MKVRFFVSEKPRERDLARAFAAGVALLGDVCEVIPRSATPSLEGCDAAAMVGVKSDKIFHACRQAGVVPLMFDKGYSRHRREGGRVWEFWRVSVGEQHPTRMLTAGFPLDRARMFGWLDFAEWRGRNEGEVILLAGSSQKYHDFHGLPDPTTWAKGVIKGIRSYTRAPIVYRPKPSWAEAVPIDGTIFSPPEDKLFVLLERTRAVVTHGSNISFEAAMAGIPSIVLGGGIGAALGARSLGDLMRPPLGDRQVWLAALAYFQWTENEMESGRMWQFLRKRVARWGKST